MRSESCEQLKAPRVATHFPSLREEIDFNTNTHVFKRHASLAVMPIGGESLQVPNFSVDIQGGSEHKTRAITILESLTSRDWHGWRGLEELLSDSVEQIARYLTWHGRVVHEIIRDVETGEARRLHGFTSRRLFHVFGRYIQIIPKADRGVWERCCIMIPEEDIWDIAMPKRLGGYQGYRAMLRKLDRCPDPAPLFLLDKVSRQEWPVYFNFQLYVREIEIFVARIMTRWGWNHGDDNLEYRTEFYWNYRNITLKWAQACLREYLVKELDQLFQRLHIEAKIVMEGLPTTQKILEIRQHMCEGKISFGDAFDACSV